MTPSSRLYVAVEGIDGTGKTFVARHISEKFNFIMVQEPSDSDIGMLVRKSKWDPATDFFLFMADRANMLRNLPSDVNIISDRSLYSSFAYQGYDLWKKFGSIDRYIDFFNSVSKMLPALPSHVFVLLSDVNKALERIKGRGELSRFERMDYLEGVQKMYLQLRNVRDNVKYIDSNVTLEKLYESVDAEIIELLR
ncbi:MAG: dTMP kinase [Thermoplasmatales archaeon]